MQGTIVKVAVTEGQTVAEGDAIVVLEAMKMEQPLKAHKAGTVTDLVAEVGATVINGAVMCDRASDIGLWAGELARGRSGGSNRADRSRGLRPDGSWHRRETSTAGWRSALPTRRARSRSPT